MRQGGRLLWNDGGLALRVRDEDAFEIRVMVPRQGLWFRFARIFANILLKLFNIGVLERYEYIQVRIAARTAETLIKNLQFRPQQLEPASERPDYRTLPAEIRVCPECSHTYAAGNQFRAELSCDECVAKRFDASVEADKNEWRQRGWEDVE